MPVLIYQPDVLVNPISSKAVSSNPVTSQSSQSGPEGDGWVGGPGISGFVPVPAGLRYERMRNEAVIYGFPLRYVLVISKEKPGLLGAAEKNLRISLKA
ncbi:hypothetical protein GCM10023189_23520 [Nibrella saemangeumensis]|uniref:Uncharacterized protein n=1 Tax=Nibrella saemangeumensis TaxID=1084526 RepID=A0ABP8MWL0_9BACT